MQARVEVNEPQRLQNLQGLAIAASENVSICQSHYWFWTWWGYQVGWQGRREPMGPDDFPNAELMNNGGRCGKICRKQLHCVWLQEGQLIITKVYCLGKEQWCDGTNQRINTNNFYFKKTLMVRYCNTTWGRESKFDEQ